MYFVLVFDCIFVFAEIVFCSSVSLLLMTMTINLDSEDEEDKNEEPGKDNDHSKEGHH